MPTPNGHVNSRLLVVDLTATSRNWSLTGAARERLAASAPSGWRIHFVSAAAMSDGDGGAPPSAEALGEVRSAEAYYGFGLSRAIFEAGTSLRWVHSAAAGVGSALFPAMVASDVVLTNGAGIYARPIAQHVLGGVLHFLRSFDIAIDLQRMGQWDKQPFVGDAATVRELSDCQVLVIGAGGLGSAIGDALSHFGAKCVGVRRHVDRPKPAGFERIVGPEQLDVELPDADVVVLSTPATPETRRLLDGGRIARLKRDSIVVNVGRGSLLDEAALATALENGAVRGAVLDVFEEEPLVAASPLWGLRNVLVTPHVSGVSPSRYWDRQLDLFIDNWTCYSDGRPMHNVVDKHAGY